MTRGVICVEVAVILGCRKCHHHHIDENHVESHIELHLRNLFHVIVNGDPP